MIRENLNEHPLRQPAGAVIAIVLSSLQIKEKHQPNFFPMRGTSRTSSRRTQSRCNQLKQLRSWDICADARTCIQRWCDRWFPVGARRRTRRQATLAGRAAPEGAARGVVASNEILSGHKPYYTRDQEGQWDIFLVALQAVSTSSRSV